MKISTHPVVIKLLVITCLFGGLQVSASEVVTIKAGPMAGTTEITETNIWVQTTGPAQVAVRYWMADQPAMVKVSPVIHTTESRYYTAQFTLSRLEYGTEYQYEILLNGTPQVFSYPLTFTTQPLWQWRTDPPELKIALGSCLYINDPHFDRPGEPYGGDPGILNTLAAQNPDMMLWLGDNIYYREADFYSESHLAYRFSHGRSVPELQPLLASTINIAIWDDHDYGPNNSDRSSRLREQALDIFKLFWANPGYGHGKTAGVFTRYQLGDVEFFLLDDRYHRAPNSLEAEDKPFLGKAQLQWLQDALLNSRAPFKFIVCGNQVTNTFAGYEVYARYTSEYDQFMSFLQREKIEGVIFLSGDRHFTELLKTDRREAYPIYEFTSSPLTSGTYSSLDESDEYTNPLRVGGTLVYQERNFGILNITGPRKNRRLTMETYTADGTKAWSVSIDAAELTRREESH